MPFLTKGKTNWKYILVILILAVIVGGGILSYSRYFKREISSLSKFPEVKKPEKVVGEETANWKTYRNDEYGFEFKYPAEFKFGVKASPEFLVYSPGAAGYLSQEAVKRSIERHWTREKKFNNALFIMYYDYCYGGAGSYSRIINAVSHNSSKNYYVNIWIELDGLGGVPQTREFWVDPTWQESYRLTEKGEEWVIQKMMNEEDEEIKIFNQMLSTFRFLE
jgi:hypothetical protein